MSRVISANEYQRERWRNGLGWTREIARHPSADGAGPWTWRLSIAEIEKDAEFSRFPGIERELVLLRGNGMQLLFGDGHRVNLKAPHDHVRFTGEQAVTANLHDGPTHDFNLMWNPQQWHAELWIRPLLGPMSFFVEPASCWAIHLSAGQAEWNKQTGLASLCAGDTTILQHHEDKAGRFALEGSGTVIVIKLTPNVDALSV